jgi:hypothetical protein
LLGEIGTISVLLLTNRAFAFPATTKNRRYRATTMGRLRFHKLPALRQPTIQMRLGIKVRIIFQLRCGFAYLLDQRHIFFQIGVTQAGHARLPWAKQFAGATDAQIFAGDFEAIGVFVVSSLDYAAVFRLLNRFNSLIPAAQNKLFSEDLPKNERSAPRVSTLQVRNTHYNRIKRRFQFPHNFKHRENVCECLYSGRRGSSVAI